jgi:hypothetical protein
MSEDNTLELISTVTEFNDLHEYLMDEGLDEALALVVKLVMKPDVTGFALPALIVKLQAYSARFQVLAVTYSTIKKDRAGTLNNNKKNIYYSMYEALDKLVAALKYSARVQGL